MCLYKKKYFFFLGAPDLTNNQRKNLQKDVSEFGIKLKFLKVKMVKTLFSFLFPTNLIVFISFQEQKNSQETLIKIIRCLQKYPFMFLLGKYKNFFFPISDIKNFLLPRTNFTGLPFFQISLHFSKYLFVAWLWNFQKKANNGT